MILVDTGPVVAAAFEKDPDHALCVETLGRAPGPLVMSPFVATEVCYFLGSRSSPAAESAFLRSLAVGTFELVDLMSEDLRRSAELVEHYADLPLGAADASVIALAERLEITTVLTLDQRHFRVVRPNHIHAFELLP